MTGVFACPECGLELAVEGTSPGREVQCEGCSTWVEVPFLPRAGSSKRARWPTRRSPWESKALRGAIGFAVVVLLGLLATRMIGGRVRSDRERVLAELVASADQAEASRRDDVALREIEAALAQARTFERSGSNRLVELVERRDRISLREAQARLKGVDSLEPDRAVGESLTILERARHDRALAPLAETIEARLAESRIRQAEADLNLARQAFESGRDADTVDVAGRLHDRAKDLAELDSRRFRDEAEALLGLAIGRSGVALPPVGGRPDSGVGTSSAETLAKGLERLRVESLRARGYLPEPRGSSWASLWGEKAPFEERVQVSETREELYLQSKNRTALIDGTFELLHRGRVIWKARMVGRTRAPLPDLPAYLAGRIATADRRDPDAERRLHDDAVVQFLEQAAKNLRSLPTREAAAKVP